MSTDKETKKRVKEYFSSKRFIIGAVVFLLALGTGVGTAMSVNRQLTESLQGLGNDETKITEEHFTENAANEITGITEKVIQPVTEEVLVVKDGEFLYPAGKKVIKDYSNSVAVKSKTMNDWRVHNGVDFQAKEGDEVKAVQSGAVLATYNSSLWGAIVEIDHGAGVVARYCGLSEKLLVGANDVVEVGQVIGYVSSIPVEAADGTHLHFEITKDGEITDPLSLFE